MSVDMALQFFVETKDLDSLREPLEQRLVDDEDLAFVLDVNAGYGPWLVSAERLFDAMNTGGWAGGLTRGLARFELA